MAGNTTTVKSSLRVNTRDFNRFARDLRKASPEIAIELRSNLKAMGEVVATEARSIVSEVSQTVPDSIKVRVRGSTVSVVAGGIGVPMGGLLELGNVKSKNSTSFRHPVFGDRSVWVNQPTHPYLLPAIEHKADAIEEAAVEALQMAIETAIHG